MASLIERAKCFQVAIQCERRRYKVRGFMLDATGRRLSEELGRNVEKLLQARAGETIPPDLRRYVEGLPRRIRRSLAKQGIIEAAAEGKPLTEQVADYKLALLHKGNGQDYANGTAAMILDGVTVCKFKMLGDVTAAKLAAYLAQRREDRPELDAKGNVKLGEDKKPIMRRGLSARRHNAIVTAWGGFFRWCLRERRAYENPIVQVTRMNERIDKRHQRRALEAGEVRALLAAAEAVVERDGMTGAEWALVYRMAVETGLRFNELRTLTRACIDLDAATVTVRAAYSKHRREDVLPMRGELVEALRTHAEKKLPAAPLFALSDRFQTLRALREDMAAAGIKPVDDAGRVVDFHALRHTFITSLATAGVHPKTAQTLARHSTITLTMDRYTHTLRGAETAALNVLPDYSSRPDAAAGKKDGDR